jgi:dUTP pyrophosphatase
MEVKVIVSDKSNYGPPAYSTKGASGMDLRAMLERPMLINPGEVVVVPTGLSFELPENFEIQVRPRSGLAAKYGLTVLNTPGTVDEDYRGEVKVIMVNHSKDTFIINDGDRIAQAVFAKVEKVELVEVFNLGDTDRGAGGFGSTGIK